MSSEVMERTFPVSGKAALKLSNISGSVSFEPGNADHISVTATKHTHHGDANRTEIVMDQAVDGLVTVSTRFSEGVLGFLSFTKPCDVDYVVSLPRTCEVKVAGVSCWLQAQGLEGALDFSTVSGEMRLESLSGNIAAASVSGDLAADHIQGSLHLKTVSGAFRLHNADASSVEASSVSGAISLQTSLGAGPYHFQTVSGDVKLDLPGETPCRAELHSISGDLRVGFPVTRSSRSKGSQQAEVGHGGPVISASSVSGSLLIIGPAGESQPVAPQAQEMPAPPAPPAPPASVDRQAVLERIDKGEISVDEAVRILQGK